MRTYLVTLVAALGLAGFVATSSAGTGGSSGGGASAGGGSGGGGGGGGGGHGGGGGGGHAGGGGAGGGGGHGGGGGAGTHGGSGGHGDGGHAGGGYGARAGYADGGSYTRQGTHGTYRVVGYESAGLGRSGVAPPRDGHIARSTFVIGPRTGSAAAARRVTDRRVSPGPGRPQKPPHKPKPGICRGPWCSETGPDVTSDLMPLASCPPRADERGYRPAGCPESVRSMPRRER